MVDTDNLYEFIQEGDNLLIHDMGLFIPYQYSRGAQSQTQVTIGWQTRDSSQNGNWNNIGDSQNALLIPEYNQWIQINAWLPWPYPTIPQDIRMRVTIGAADVNQINAPAILNGDTITSKLMFRVSSNLKLST